MTCAHGGSPAHLAGSKWSRKIRCPEPKNQSILLILVVAEKQHPRSAPGFSQSEGWVWRVAHCKNAHAMSCIVTEGLRALCCTPPVQFYPPCAHECSRMPPRVRAWPRDSAPGRVHASGFQGRALAKHAGQVWARAAGSAHLQALPG